jgi:hypothetical protein
MWKTHGEQLAQPGASIGNLEFPTGKLDPASAKIDPASAKALDSANDLKALSAIALGMLSMHVEETRLRTNQVPTLFVIGEHDPFKPAAYDAVAAGLNMAIRELPGRLHGNTPSDPNYAEAIRRFFRD